MTESTGNWARFSHRDDDASSDRAATLSTVMCLIGNKELLAIADHELKTILEIDRVSDDKERNDCAMYRRQCVKTYNLVRDHIATRSRKKRYRGELLQILDFIPGVRNNSEI